MADPFGIKVNQLHGGLSGARCVGALNLGTPVKVGNLAIEDHTEQTQVERVAVSILLVFTLILKHAIAAELNVFDPLRQFDGLLFFLLGIDIQCEAHREDGQDE